MTSLTSSNYMALLVSTSGLYSFHSFSLATQIILLLSGRGKETNKWTGLKAGNLLLGNAAESNERGVYCTDSLVISFRRSAELQNSPFPV